MIQIFDLDEVMRRVRRSAREIVLAVTLTLAALIFAYVALQGTAPETAAVIDPDTKADSKPN